MVYTYTPTYYTSLQDSVTSLCKSILPFSFKKRRLPAIAAAEQQLSKQQSDNLKWQQDSFHQILNLMGLCKEGILAETEVSAFRIHLLETLIASPIDHEPTVILRDKLIFLQELFYAKCISEDEYHASKRPLLQRLAVQGAEIKAQDVIMGTQKETSKEDWSVIDLKDEKCLYSQEGLMSRNKSKRGSTMKQIKGAASVFGFVSPIKNGKLKEEKDDNNLRTPLPIGQNVSIPSFKRNEVGLSTENPFWNCNLIEKENETKSILMAESLPADSVNIDKRSTGDKPKKKPFRTLFQREGRVSAGGGGGGDHHSPEHEEKEKTKSGKKQWGFDGFKKWKKNDSDDETAPLSLTEKSDGESYTGRLVMNPAAEGPDTTQIKRKLHPNGAPTDFFVDKVLGENIKKELSRIQTELGAKNQDFHLSDDQLEAISTRLPVDKADLKKFFPKSWCDRYGDVVLDVVRKEFKEHVGEMGNSRVVAKEKRNSKRWATFDDDDENCHPNLFAPQEQATFSSSKMARASINRASINTSSSIDKGFKYNPFFDV